MNTKYREISYSHYLKIFCPHSLEASWLIIRKSSTSLVQAHRQGSLINHAHFSKHHRNPQSNKAPNIKDQIISWLITYKARCTTDLYLARLCPSQWYHWTSLWYYKRMTGTLFSSLASPSSLGNAYRTHLDIISNCILFMACLSLSSVCILSQCSPWFIKHLG